jgi:hypothetical protein
MGHTKKLKKNSSKSPKLTNKPLEDDPMKTRRRNKFPKPRPNNKNNKKSGTDDTKGIPFVEERAKMIRMGRMYSPSLWLHPQF